MIYVVKRAVIGGLQLMLLSAILFVVFRIAPGDYFTATLENPQQSNKTVAALRKASGLERSVFTQYSSWLASSLRGDFGQSIAYGLPVRQLLAPRIAKTLQIAIPGLLLAWLVGLGGALVLRRRAVDPGVAAAAMVPDVIVISLVLWIAVMLGVSINGLWLPTLGLTLSIVPVVFLHASSELAKARELPFVRIARSRGIDGTRLWLRYIMPAAANPLVSLAGLSIAAAIGSSFVIETLTGWPGVGPLFLDAVQARDYPIVLTTLMALSTVLIVSNLAADLLLYRLDPRIRSSAA